jgi:hypothetical protein
MSETLTKLVVDCASGEQQIIPLTEEEIAQLEADRLAMAQVKAEQEAEAQAKAVLKASAKAKLIAGEPLTAEEADVLVL